MSDYSKSQAEDRTPFSSATVALILAVGAVGFVGAMLLAAYSPELGQYDRTGGHALSNGATGYSGLVQLAAATGRNPEILRDKRQWDVDDLVIVTPEAAATSLDGMLEARFSKLPTLYILPKWKIVPDPQRKGWVRTRGLLPVEEPEGVFAPGWKFEISRHDKPVRTLVSVDPGLPRAIRFAPPKSLQVISSQGLEQEDNEPGDVNRPANEASDGRLVPIITDGSGGIVLGRIDGLFILSDPDLLDNAGLKRPENAGAALALIDWLNGEEAEAVGFDVVLNGIGGSRSILRLAFDPPFLALTLTLAAVVLLLGLRAVGQFGAPRLRARAIDFGKSALVDNCAMLVRKAGRTHRLGGRYAAVVREQAIRAFGVSPRLKAGEVDAYLDGLGNGPRFTELATRAGTANDDTGMLAAARALHMWKQEKLSDY